MLNDRSDKFEGQDDSEYHFSDDEVSYELEDESSKSSEMAVEAGSEASSPKESLINQLTKSKRMLGSVVVFIVLVLVVYKMVVPSSSSAPTTDIVAGSGSATMQPQATTPPTQQAMPGASQAQAPVSAPVQPGSTQQAGAQPIVTVVPAATQPAESSQSQIAPVQQAQQTIPALPALPASAQPMAQQAMAAATSMVQQAAAAAALPNQGNAATTASQPIASMPTVIPVPTPVAVEQAQSAVSSGGYMVPSANNVDEKLAAMSANNERMMGQLQGQYTQQFNDFSNQNRAVQDQIQALTARVSVIENQLNQLIQALTKRNAGTSLNTPARVEPQNQASEAKIAYNVQAIIPGRAWLKSDNGETLTVAEGDTIKGVGRVTKIDPYDGVVEINTGSKSVSLSYGESA